MNQSLPVTIATGRPMERALVLQLLRAARHADEPRFARRLAELWLDAYPGDLGITLINAQAMADDNRFDLAIPLLKRLCNQDPEFLEAQVVLARAGSQSGAYEIESALGNTALLNPRLSLAANPPDWAVSTREALIRAEKDEQDVAISALKQVIATEPPSPLPGLFLLQWLRRQADESSAREWAAELRARWPDCLTLQLVLAEDLMRSGQSASAVQLLHQTAAADITAQTARRLWGIEFPYRNIWPRELTATLDLPIPAAVASALGWNQLAGGPTRRAKATKSSRPASHRRHAQEELISIQDELDRLARSLQQPQYIRADGRFPAYILLTNKSGLEARYGVAAFPQIVAELDKLAAATRQSGRWAAHVVVIDDARHTTPLDLQPLTQSDPWEIKNLLRDLDANLSTQGERLGALFIIGGPDIIPFHLLPNPVDDEDTEIPSDNPYATLDENYFIPAWPVGRLATGHESSPDHLIGQIRTITTNRLAAHKGGPKLPSWLRFLAHWLTPDARKESIGISAQVWQRASLAVFRTIGKPHALDISPPLQTGSALAKSTKKIQLGYFNLHGLADTPEWFGQRDPLEDQHSPDYPVALRPEDIQNGGRAPRIIFSEACYGAHIYNKTIKTAIALKFLASGAETLVGSTCISYGSITTPLIAADLLGRLFWTHLREGFPTGEALRRAKINLAREMDRRQGYLDGEDQKTLISFVLYGDPLTNLDPSLASPKTSPRTQPTFIPKTVCDKRQMQEAPAALPEEALHQVKAIVSEYLPGLRGAQITLSHEHTVCHGHDCPTNHLHAKQIPAATPQRKVVTLTKLFAGNGHSHTQVARITLDNADQVVKVAVSR